jgi:aromatic ring-opening dioxygenase catalytic subunit (LigB family)
MPASKEELNEYNRYEVVAVSPHFGQSTVGIYQTLKEASDHRELLFRSQDLPLFIYDTIKQERV